MRPTAALAWIRTPRRFDFFRGWTIGERELFHLINWAHQYNKRNGRISVPELATFSGYSARHVYRILRRLKDRGVVYSLVTPGYTAVYYLRFEYCAPRTPTRDNQHVRGGRGVNTKEEIDKYRYPPRTGKRNGPTSVRDDREPPLVCNSYSTHDLALDMAELAREGLQRTMERDRQRFTLPSAQG
jgi:hypothetical protein